MKTSTKDQMKGKLHQVKGTAKQRVGQITKNPRLRVEGQLEKMAGKMQQKIGQMEGVFKR
jgi:uncharacterized protein YjbJ (UPF0337 family)